MKSFQELSERAIRYKKRVAGCFMLVQPEQLSDKLSGENYAVTRKIDGVMQLLFFDRGQAVMAGTGGVIREKLPCLDEFAEILRAKGIRSAVVAAELYVPSENARPRVYDVLSALGQTGDPACCALAPFDLLELDGNEFKADHYRETHRRLTELFGDSAKVKPVEMRLAQGKAEVSEIFAEWVSGENAEGLVVHSESPIVWKIKPHHTIDAVVVGYSLEDDHIRDLLVATRDENGDYRIFGKCSNGLSADERKSLLDTLAVCPSDYIYVDEHQLAFQMVKPEMVLELSVAELLAENSAGKVKKNSLVSLAEGKWSPHGSVPGVSALGMKIERFRPDKGNDVSDIRSTQLSDLVPFAAPDIPDRLPGSTLLDRRVFRKTSGDKVFLHKFLIWATNKQEYGYGKYVFFHTDYSSGRKEPLKRDLKVAATEEKVREFLAAAIAENISKSYQEIRSDAL